jgi:cell division protein FtsI (penicillin-binding protein 3)
MSGKTGTAKTEYWMKDYEDNPRYVSSFAGYFPAENPKYSCIVVIHKPSTKKGYYGADVSGPVFKRIAQKIFTDTPIIDEVLTLEIDDITVEEEYNAYFSISEKYETIMPNVIGLPTMDAIAILENMGLNVKSEGNGEVVSQSITKGIKIKKNQTVVIQAS